MGKFSGVLLTSDFDNTLIYTEDALRSGVPVPPLSEANRTALEYFMAEGGHFAIATGRALAAFRKYVDQVPMNTPGVVCNGAALYDFAKGEYLETALLDGIVRERGQEILEHFPEYLPKFKKIIPMDYQKMISTIGQMEEKGMDHEQATMEAFYRVSKEA